MRSERRKVGLVYVDGRNCVSEQIQELGLLGGAGLGIDVLQVGASRDFADTQHGGDFLDA